MQRCRQFAYVLAPDIGDIAHGIETPIAGKRNCLLLSGGKFNYPFVRVTKKIQQQQRKPTNK